MFNSVTQWCGDFSRIDDILKRPRWNCRITDYDSWSSLVDLVTWHCVGVILTRTHSSLSWWRLKPLSMLYFRNREFKLSIFLYRGTERQRTDLRSTLSPDLTVILSSAVAVCVLLCEWEVEVYYRYLLSAPVLILTLGRQIHTCTCCFSFCSVTATRAESNRSEGKRHSYFYFI